jgi:hypothetical protein
MKEDTIPPVLRMLNEENNRPRSKQEDEAARLFVLGQITIAEYLAAKRP